VAVLTPLSVDGMIVAASTTLLADSRSGGRGGVLPWALLVAGSLASLAANVAVAEPSTTGRVIAAWPSFALIAAYELLMRQVRCAADGSKSSRPGRSPRRVTDAASSGAADPAAGPRPGSSRRDAGRELQLLAWQWALANRTGDGSLPSGREIARQFGRHERWGRMVKRSGTAGELAAGSEPSEPSLRLVGQRLPPATGK
jgi:hypothetical protein